MDIKQLIDKRAKAWSDAQEYNARYASGTEMSPEDNQCWERALADVDKFGAEIERLERTATLESRFAEIDAATTPAVTRGEPATRDEYADAFGAYLRNGMGRLTTRQQDLVTSNAIETRDMGIATGAAGGFSVPQGFWAKVTETLKFYAVVASISDTITTDSGNPLPWATNDDTSNIGELLTENTAAANLDLVLGQKTLNAYMYSSKMIKVSRQLLQDTGIDIETFLAKKIGQRLGRIVNSHFTTGTGSSQPQGFITGATTGITAANATSQVTNVIYDSLVDLQHSVDAAYREGGNCVWAMNDLSLGIVRKLKDTQGRPLWEPSLQSGAPSTLLGHPVKINNFMATMAASAKSLAFGDFSSAYVVRLVNGGSVLRLEERYADALQVGFLGFGRYDGLTQDASAVKLFVNAAS